jgi:hypothetical protein
MMFMSVFQAASLINFMGGAIGIGPGYVLLVAFLVKSCIFDRKRPQRRRTSRAAAILLITFTIYAAASAFINPLVFEGVRYTNAKIGEGVPLRWETGHLNQLVYLFINVALFFFASFRCSAAELRRSLNWFVSGCVVASLIAICQFICLRTGLPFPAEFLHTNTSYATFEAYDIGQFARTNATFVEASSAALFLPPAFAVTVWRLVVRPNWKDAACALLISSGVFLTISTTGYLCFFFLAVLAMFILIAKWKAANPVRANKLAVVVGLSFLLIGLAAVPSVRVWTADLLDTVIFSKKQTFSYQQRSQMNEDGLQTAIHTLWLGAGWGVCRASSLLPTLLGNVGIPGVALFAGFIAQVFHPAWRSTRQSIELKGPAMFAASVCLVALLISGPEITNPPVWVFFAIATTTFMSGPRRLVVDLTPAQRARAVQFA